MAFGFIKTIGKGIGSVAKGVGGVAIKGVKLVAGISGSKTEVKVDADVDVEGIGDQIQDPTAERIIAVALLVLALLLGAAAVAGVFQCAGG
jgi:hypothetical protein